MYTYASIYTHTQTYTHRQGDTLVFLYTLKWLAFPFSSVESWKVKYVSSGILMKLTKLTYKFELPGGISCHELYQQCNDVYFNITTTGLELHRESGFVHLIA